MFFELIPGANVQTNAFQKIEYASFDVNSYRTKTRDSAYIGMYFFNSDNGLMVVNDHVA